MPTREERREIAARLREVARSCYDGFPAAAVCDALGIPRCDQFGSPCYSNDGVLALADMIEPGREYEDGYCAGVQEAYDEGYRAGLQAARDKFDRDGGRVVPVAEVRINGDRLEELVQEAVKEIRTCDREALLSLADSMEDANGPGSVCDRCMRGTSAKIKAACGCDPEARLWKVTGGSDRPMLLVRAAGVDAAVARAREVDPGYCGAQRWDYRYDGVVPDGAEVLE